MDKKYLYNFHILFHLKIHLSNIFENIKDALIKIIKYEIENNMIYKLNDKDIHHNSIFPFLKISIRIIIQIIIIN